MSRYDSYGQMDAARGKGWAARFNGKGEYTKRTARGHQYRAGVSAFGVNLYAQSTYSSQDDIHYKFGPNGEHRLYRSNGTVGNAAAVYAW